MKHMTDVEIAKINAFRKKHSRGTRESEILDARGSPFIVEIPMSLSEYFTFYHKDSYFQEDSTQKEISHVIFHEEEPRLNFLQRIFKRFGFKV